MTSKFPADKSEAQREEKDDWKSNAFSDAENY